MSPISRPCIRYLSLSTRTICTWRSFLFKDVDASWQSPQVPYSGPYEVIHRKPKYFILRLPYGDTSVSIDRLKPAYAHCRSLDADGREWRDWLMLDHLSWQLPQIHCLHCLCPASDDPCVTRSGCSVHFKGQCDYFVLLVELRSWCGSIVVKCT